jgi:hypothetical protein
MQQLVVESGDLATAIGDFGHSAGVGATLWPNLAICRSRWERITAQETDDRILASVEPFDARMVRADNQPAD